MTITSTGYAGTIGEAQWSTMIPRVGAAIFAVNDYASFRVTTAAGTRTVQVAPGGASCRGIYDVSDAIETVSLASVTSGTRWDMVVLRRTWATKTTSVFVIQGGSAKTLPARSSSAGVVYDQPLALVRVIAGSSAIQEVVDLRCAGLSQGGTIAWDDLARSYLAQAGSSVRIGDVRWTRMYDSSGNGIWAKEDVTPDSGWVNITRNNGWGWAVAQVRRVGSLCFYQIRASRGAGWGTGDGLIDAIPAAYRPSDDWYVASSHGTGRTEFRFTKEGRVVSTVPSGGATGVTLYGSYPIG